MIGDHFTKPLQVSFFCELQNTILGITETEITGYIRLAKLAWTAQQTIKSKWALKLEFGQEFYLMETAEACWALNHLDSQLYIDLRNIIHAPRRASQSCT